MKEVGVVPIGSFSWALMRLKDGGKICRRHWGGYWFIPEGAGGGELVNKKTGLCAEFTFNKNLIVACLKDGNGYVPATAYQEDLMADDWEELE